MKAKIPILLFFTVLTTNIIGQINHVLNYSFENYTNCSSIGNCSGSGVNNWYEPTLLGFNWCSYPCFGSSATAGVPQNYAGYQYARTGNAYGAISMCETGHTRLYVTGTLSDSLTATKKYCVAFYVSLSDSLWFAVSAVGAYLSNDSISCNPNSDTVLHYAPQVENPSNTILTNKVDWIPISEEYIAKGGEKFITIGDFYSDTLSHFTYVGNGGTVAGWENEVNASYYVDDVYVRELTIANAGKSDTVCLGDSVLIGKDTITPGVSFHWLPTAGLSNPNIAQPKASPTIQTTYTLTVINDSIHNCNCADSITWDSVTINVCTGIKELKNSDIFNVFPNPNNGTFTLTYKMGNESKSNLIIYDEIGMVVGNYLLNSASGTMQISNQSLRQGLYFYKVFTESGIKKVGKIVIIK